MKPKHVSRRGKGTTLIDITGQKFGKLTAIKRADTSSKKVFWVCKCDCGNLTTVESYKVRTGHTTSCGCVNAANLAKGKPTHGYSKTRTYLIWSLMIHRCRNPNSPIYHHYGGRGITVDPKWDTFMGFLEDMGKAPDELTLDRIDNDKGYSKENCRWVTMAVQANNKRNNRYLTSNGETLSLSQWARKLGVCTETIRKRLNRGWTVESAVTVGKLENRRYCEASDS